MKITSPLFAAFLKCPTKCYLRSLGETGAGNDYADWVRAQDESYAREAVRRLQATVPETECVTAPPADESLKSAKWRLAVDLVAQASSPASSGSVPLPGRAPGETPGELANETSALQSHLLAVERVPAEGRGKAAQFVPIRFSYRNKLTADDRLLLAFDALVLAQALGRDVSLGKIIHGDDHATPTVKLAARTAESARTPATAKGLAGEVRKRIGKITALLAAPAATRSANSPLPASQPVAETRGLSGPPSAPPPPDLVLNRHCGECEFRDRCRKLAQEKDDLSLLGGMNAKERQELRSRGIFTVTQLSYTFRPRRRPKKLRNKREKYHHSLKALAIREKKIHIFGSPELKIDGTPVYLDVEALPDLDFYYLIGLRIGNGDSAIQHSLWADIVADEGKIWQEFLAILQTVEKPVLIHYGSYETTFLTRMRERYVGPVESNEIKATKRSVNLLSVIFAQVYYPVFSNGLKDIAGSLGFSWTAAGFRGGDTITCRHNWEKNQEAAAKERLLTYNAEDCLALMKVTENLQFLLRGDSANFKAGVAVDDLIGNDDFGRWGQRKFAIEEFRLMADCAYFDYQRSKVYIRSNPEMQQVNRRKRKRQEVRNTPDIIVSLRSSRCWRCKSPEIVRVPDRWHHKLQLDLRISKGGIKKKVTEFRAPFYYCTQCKTPCFSRSYKSKKRFGHNLLAWVVHQHVTNRLSFDNLRITLKECFGIRVATPDLQRLKYQAARYYKSTYDQILRNILANRLIHADETRMKLSQESGYVWVFTSMFDVVYLYRPTREGEFLREMLKGFQGVLVTDFYSVYDSLSCDQQKCLVHLMWDLNWDLLKNPFDEDLKDLIGRFGELCRRVIRTVDKSGLKARFLRKHQKEVREFYAAIGLRQIEVDPIF